MRPTPTRNAQVPIRRKVRWFRCREKPTLPGRKRASRRSVVEQIVRQRRQRADVGAAVMAMMFLQLFRFECRPKAVSISSPGRNSSTGMRRGGGERASVVLAVDIFDKEPQVVHSPFVRSIPNSGGRGFPAHRHVENPRKIGLSTHFSLYTGIVDPLSFSCKCGSQALSRRAGVRIVHPGESEEKEHYGSNKMTQSQLIKELAAAVEVPNKTAKAFTLAYAEMAMKETKKNGCSGIARHRPAGACGSQGSHGPQPGDRRSDQDSG